MRTSRRCEARATDFRHAITEHVPGSSRKFIIGVAAVLIAGTLIGWIYGRPDWGLLIASLLVLLWQIRQLLSFNRALQTGDFENFRYLQQIVGMEPVSRPDCH